MVHLSVFARPAVAGHRLFAVSAEQLAGQMIGRVVRLLPAFHAFYDDFFLLYIVECTLVDDCRAGARDLALIGIIADVHSVCQDGVQGVRVKRAPCFCFVVPLVAGVHDLGLRLAFCAELVDEADDVRGFFVDDKAFVFNSVPERDIAAGGQPFQRIFPHAACGVLAELGGVHFGRRFEDSFEDDAFVILSDAFCGRKDTHAEFLETRFVNGAVVSVTAESVELPHDDELEDLFRRIGNHALKLGTVVLRAAHGAVYIFADYGIAHTLGVFAAIAELPVDGLLVLLVRRIAGVNYCIHMYSFLYVVSIVKTSRAWIVFVFHSFYPRHFDD